MKAAVSCPKSWSYFKKQFHSVAICAKQGGLISLDRCARMLLVWRNCGGTIMATLRGEQIIAQCFKREGVDTIFFMMGGPTGGTAGACLELGMEGIYVRHEQAGAMMEHAVARIT